MAFITISVPDAKFDYYKQILSEFKELSMEDNTNELHNGHSLNNFIKSFGSLVLSKTFC